jgi:hypothetical protein
VEERESPEEAPVLEQVRLEQEAWEEENPLQAEAVAAVSARTLEDRVIPEEDITVPEEVAADY